MEKCKRTRKATVYVKDLDMFVTVQLLEDIPPVLSLAHLCEYHGHSHEWTSGQKPYLITEWRKCSCNTENYVPIVVPGLSTGSSSSTTSTSTKSLSQDSVSSTSSPASTRNQSTSDEALGDQLREPSKNQTKIKMRRTSTEHRETCCRICLIVWKNSQ